MFEISVIEKNNEQWVDARELAVELGVNTDGGNFAKWMESNVFSVGFESEKDFRYHTTRTKGRPRKDYYLTVETAKHISLMSNTKKGKEIRNYFIAIHEAYIKGQIKQLESESADRINYLESAVDQRDKILLDFNEQMSKLSPKDPIGTESKTTGRPRIHLRKACYVSRKNDDPNQLVFGFQV